VAITSRVGQTVLRARIVDRMPQGVVYTTFHYPASGANIVTTENSDWATNCPEYKVTAVQVMPTSQAPASDQSPASVPAPVQLGLVQA
jgi:formate dehydrogenase major subunit